jgi:heme exporter protein D
MELGPYASFIVASFAIAIAAVLSLIAWVVADYRRQLRILADLEARGVKRRSDIAREAS